MNMKKIVFLSLLALCLPGVLSAQSIDDDLYYVPSKKKEEKVEKEDSGCRCSCSEDKCADYGLCVAGQYNDCGEGS